MEALIREIIELVAEAHDAADDIDAEFQPQLHRQLEDIVWALGIALKKLELVAKEFK